MEIVGVALAIPPTIEICLKYGNELRAMCAALRNAEAEIRERVLRLDYGWVRWSQQLSSLQRIEHMMDQYHREVYAQTLETFLAKLKMVTTQLRGLVVERKPDATVKKLGYLVNATTNYEPRSVVYVLKKKSLDKAIEELEIWQRMSDHSWFLLLKMADPAIDAAIGTYGNSSGVSKTIPSVAAIRAGNQKFKDNGTMSTNPGTSGITFKPKDLAHNIITTIPFSNASLAVRKDGSRAYILSIIICPHPSKYQLVKKDTRDLVRKLQHDEPQTFGLLNCKGFVVEQIPPQPRHNNNTNNDEHEPDVKFTVIFRHPFHGSASKPRSLRDLLLTGPRPFSLSTRFEVARELAKSVSFVHSFGFVHKNIRPEALLSFSDGPAPTYYLVGFENFRREDGWTRQAGDDSLEHNLYRHPSRQGVSPREYYIMQHDIYSLGVCLLEVGLWVSFIAYRPSSNTRQGASNDDESGYHTSTHHPGLVPIPSSSLELPDEVFDDEGNNGRMFSYLETRGKDHMVTLARERLPCVMGTKYAEIVETCLTCLDKKNADFGDASEFEDEDGIRVGVRYIEKVLLQLNVLNV
ncbi:hypothetical protein V8F33_006650 [Rhypophila sp. PSN 637]